MNDTEVVKMIDLDLSAVVYDDEIIKKIRNLKVSKIIVTVDNSVVSFKTCD